MTKDLFEQYSDIVEEIEEIKKEMHTPVHDTVSGSMTEYPYTQHPIAIKGVPTVPVKSQRLEMLQKQRDEIKLFADQLPVSKQRRIAKKVMEHGAPPPWKQIVAELGFRYTERKVRYWYEKIWKIS